MAVNNPVLEAGIKCIEAGMQLTRDVTNMTLSTMLGTYIPKQSDSNNDMMNNSQQSTQKNTNFQKGIPAKNISTGTITNTTARQTNNANTSNYKNSQHNLPETTTNKPVSSTPHQISLNKTPITPTKSVDPKIDDADTELCIVPNECYYWEDFQGKIQLKNPSRFKLKSIGVTAINIIPFDIGIKYDPDTKSIVGKPTEITDVKIELTYRCGFFAEAVGQWFYKEKQAILNIIVKENPNLDTNLKFKVSNINQFSVANLKIELLKKAIDHHVIDNVTFECENKNNFIYDQQNDLIKGYATHAEKQTIKIKYHYKNLCKGKYFTVPVNFYVLENKDALRLNLYVKTINGIKQFEHFSEKIQSSNTTNLFAKNWEITKIVNEFELQKKGINVDIQNKTISGYSLYSGNFSILVEYNVKINEILYPFTENIDFRINNNEEILNNLRSNISTITAQNFECYQNKLTLTPSITKYDPQIEDVNFSDKNFSYDQITKEIFGFPTTNKDIRVDISYKYPTLPAHLSNKTFKTTATIQVASNYKKPELEFKLKNAKCDENFSEALELTTSTLSSIDNYDVIDIDFHEGDIGLFYNSNNKRVEGTPNIGGKNINATVIYTYHKDKLNDPKWQNLVKMKADLKFFVNNNSKTLWNKVIPSDPNEVYWKPDTANDFAKGIEKNIVAGRYRGRSHAIKGTCCDDDFYIKYNLQHDCYIAIVADGAGSAKFSRQASKLAVNTAGNFINSNLNEYIPKIEDIINTYKDPTGFNKIDCHKEIKEILYKLLGGAVTSAHNSIKIEFNSKQDLIKEIKNLSTTLLIAVAKKIRNYWLCAAYWVGDGAIAVYKESTNSVKLLGEVDSGEFSGQTRFLSQKEIDYNDINKRIQYVIVQDDFTAFMLMSDGVSDPKFHMESNLNKVENWKNFWNELNNEVPSLKTPTQQTANDLMEWLNFWSEGEHDDRTLAIIY